MYKVFVNDKLIKLIDDFTDYQSDEHTLFMRYYAIDTLEFAIEMAIHNKKFKQLIIFSEDLENLWSDFKSFFQLMNASGGLVKNKEGELLFIFKRGKWDLPKGKVDEGESKKKAALREVNEECGVDNLKITEKIGSTYHIFPEAGNLILKKTNWYNMTTKFEGELKVDKQEGIEFAKWLKNGDMKEVESNTYPSIIEIIQLSKSV